MSINCTSNTKSFYLSPYIYKSNNTDAGIHGEPTTDISNEQMK